MKNVVSGPGAVVLGIAPIEMMVVHERAIHDDATVRLQSASNNVRGVRRGAPVTGWAGTAFGIGFDKEPREVRNQAINLISLLLPPGLHARIERIKRVQPTKRLWATQIHRNAKPDAPGTKRIGNAGKLREKIGS